jgi:hypothetical protein
VDSVWNLVWVLLLISAVTPMAQARMLQWAIARCIDVDDSGQILLAGLLT